MKEGGKFYGIPHLYNLHYIYVTKPIKDCKMPSIFVKYSYTLHIEQYYICKNRGDVYENAGSHMAG